MLIALWVAVIKTKQGNGSIGEAVEELDPVPCCGNAKWCSHCGKQVILQQQNTQQKTN